MSYYSAIASGNRRAAMARAASQAREARLMQKARSAQERLLAAERAYQQGDIRVACRILISVIHSRPPAAVVAQARRRLEQLGDEALKKLREIDAALIAGKGDLSPGDEPFEMQWQTIIQSSFDEFDQLLHDYGSVPGANRELRKHVGRKRRLPEYAAVLSEPEAGTLWELAQQHEQDGHTCCAYWVYKDAARLSPAASALRAQDRLIELEGDPQIVAAAKACRDLQLCHKMYKSAERIVHTNPDRARDLFSQIVDRAPEDSQLSLAARRHMVQLR